MLAPLDVLFVEQEAYLDHVFGVMSKDIATAFTSDVIDVSALEERIRANIEATFGIGRTDALNSLVGRTLLTYADSAYKEAMKRSLALSLAALGEDGLARRIAADRGNDAKLTTVLAMLTPALIVASLAEAEGSGIVRQEMWEDALRNKYARILAGHDGGSATALDYLVARYPVPVAQMETVVRVGVAGAMPSQEMDAAKLVWGSPALLSSYVNSVMPVPLVLNDTARWEVNGRKLADRIFEAGQTIRTRLERMVKMFSARQDKPAALKKQMNVYLTAKYRPERDEGTVKDTPGALARIGKGQASWPVRLLGRNEMNRAHGRASLMAATASESAPCVMWVLAPSHAQVDDCDDNADGSSHGLPRGVYRWHDAPLHPTHVGCLCHLQQCDERGA